MEFLKFFCSMERKNVYFLSETAKNWFVIIQNTNKVTRANKYAHILEGTYKSYGFSLVSIEIL